VVGDAPEEGGILHQHGGAALVQPRFQRAPVGSAVVSRRRLDDFHGKVRKVRADDRPVERVYRSVQEDPRAAGEAKRHHRRLGQGRAAVVEGGVGGIRRSPVACPGSAPAGRACRRCKTRHATKYG